MWISEFSIFLFNLNLSNDVYNNLCGFDKAHEDLRNSGARDLWLVRSGKLRCDGYAPMLHFKFAVAHICIF